VTASACSLSRSWDLRSRSPYRRSPSHVPCKSRRSGSRRLYAGHHLARNTGTRQAHPSGQTKPSVSMPSIPFDASTTTPGPSSGRALWSVFLIPTLTGSSPAFSLDAHHDGLQPTQHQGGLAPAPAGPTLEGQQSSISRTAPPIRGLFYTGPPSAFVTHICRAFSRGEADPVTTLALHERPPQPRSSPAKNPAFAGLLSGRPDLNRGPHRPE
jgi:hypothetical protein